MINTSLYNVKIGIYNNEGKFIMSPLMRNIDICLIGTLDKNSQKKIELVAKCFDIVQLDKKIIINIICQDGKVYTVNSFLNSYMEYLNKFTCNVTELINDCKIKISKYPNICKVANLSIVTKINGRDVFIPPIDGIKLKALGDFSGDKYLKKDNKKAQICDLNYYARTITSKHSLYEITSISKEYENYLIDTFSPTTMILEYFSK